MQKLSRRQILFGTGVIGTGAAFCSCFGLSIFAYQMGRQMKEQRQQEDFIILENANTATSTPQVVPAPAIVRREEWGAWPPDHTAVNESGFYASTNPEGWLVYADDLQNVYQTVVLHHSAFYEQTDIRTMHEIQRQHREDRGWADTAYHFIVGRTGVIYEGRDWAARGSHVEGYNTGSIGVCLLGNYEWQQATDAQLASAGRLINWLAYRLELSHIAGHRHFNAQTRCPGQTLIPMIAQFAANARLQVGIEGYVPGLAEETSCECCSCDAG